MKKFPELFKKYRLRAEFETFASFGNALSEKGYHYEESIFSHWQKGARIPNNRKLILKIIEIFIEKDAIKTIDQANEFLESVSLGYLTDKEIADFPQLKQSIFQVPSEITAFAGREEVLEFVQKEATDGKTILIYGPAGVGKTTLAIRLGHLLRHHFTDGVLWYRMDTSKMKDVLIAIGHILNEDLPESKDIAIRAAFIRSVLARKRILLLFDNVDKDSNLHLLLPYGSLSSIIVLSRQKDLYLPTEVEFVFLESFGEKEVILLFRKMLGKKYVVQHKKVILDLSSIVGNLPLAVHVLASQLEQSDMSAEKLLDQGKKEAISLHALSYENKDLYLALNVSYKNLSEKARAVFLSLGVFEGKDFSVEAIAYINGMTIEKTKIVLNELHNTSLIELSVNNKFRIHPMVKLFITEKLTNPKLSMLMKIVGFSFIIFTIYWIIAQLMSLEHIYNFYIFSATYFIVAVYGGLWGIGIAKKWGGLKSIMGKAIFFFSLGLFSQSVGQILYLIYDILFHIQAAYPSLGDIGYFGTIPLYIYGVLLLIKASGIKIEFFSIKQNLKIFVFAVFILIIEYLFLLQQYKFDLSNPMKILLDFVYPLGGWIYTYLVLLLYLKIKKTKNSNMKDKVVLFFIALFVQFLADYVFIYQKNAGTWQVGQINDYMYFFAYLLMTLAIIRINSGISKIITK